MKRIGIMMLSSLAVMGCQQSNEVPLRKEVEALKKGQEKILAAIKARPAPGPAGRRPSPSQRPQRPKPNPASVYSVNISGAPFKGAKDAKVTIVEAFEFA